MPYLHLKSAKTKTANKFKKIINVAGGAILRPIGMVNSQKQRLMTLFLCAVFTLSVISPTGVVMAEGILQEQARKNSPLKSNEPNKFSSTSAVTEAAKSTALPTEDPVTTMQAEAAKKAKVDNKPATELTKEELDVRNSKKPKVDLNKEIKNKRSAYSNSYLNSDGDETQRFYNEQINYKKNGEWVPVIGTLVTDDEYVTANQPKESLLSRILPGKPFVNYGIKQNDGLLQTNFYTLDDSEGAMRIGAEGSKPVLLSVVEANKQVNPLLQNNNDTQSVLYKNAWDNVDLYYELRSGAVKEYITINSKDARSSFDFKIKGGALSYGKNEKGELDGTVIIIADEGQVYILPQLTVSAKNEGPITNPKVKYVINGDTLTIELDNTWLKEQPDANFPINIDPTYAYHGLSTGIPGGDLGQFIPYKSDGYVCNSTNCNVNAGTLYNSGVGYRTWRTMMHLPLTDVFGKSVHSASIYTERYSYSWSGYDGNRPYWATWAHCFGYNCISGAPQAYGYVDWAGTLDATGLMQWISQNNVGDGWLMIWGNEGDIYSYKAFSGARTFLDVNYIHYNQPAPIPTLAEPAQNGVISVSRPTLKMNAVSDPDGDTVRYAFHLLDSKGNIAAHSGELDTTWWTIPDGILVDGETYSWRGFVLERNTGNLSVVENGWRQTETRSFRYDLRTGKDKTQTYDDIGAYSVSLNKGNGYTNATSHGISALGGTIGLGLDYNTPDLVQQGLTANYFNGIVDKGAIPAITVNDPNVDMIWGSSSPYPGVVQADNFTVNWEGYFIAPESGVYKFGAGRDDRMRMSIAGQQQFDYGCCGWTMSDITITLEKGKAYPVSIWYWDATGYAAAHLNVQLPSGSAVRVASEWLRSLPDPKASDSQGLTAKFYQNTDTAANPNYALNDKTPLVFATKVPQINSNWGEGSLVPYDVGPFRDYMIVNYSGYITIPTSGKYKFGSASDDGVRIRLGGKEVAANWAPHGVLETWSGEIYFDAGTIVPIQVDYFEANYGATVNLMWNGPAGVGVIPAQHLTTAPKVVPNGWTLGIDPDGNIPYEALNTKPNGNAEIVDGDGFVHIYTWNGTGFKPPINEDGYLVRNADATYTLTDVDGTVYIFSSEGTITTISYPIDDKKPSALKYEYKNTTNNTYAAYPKLYRIVDGVDSNRFGQLYYWGEEDASTVCGAAPEGFTAPKTGMLCAFKTTPDNRVTRLHYDSYGNLARIEEPGAEISDYAYDSVGKLITLRDVTANDAIAYGKRTKDGTETTQIEYDGLSRVNKVTLPAPFAANTVPAGQNNERAEHSFEYGFMSTKSHIKNEAEPNKYYQYIEYDNLYRTTKDCDVLALCDSSIWHKEKDLLLSTLDAANLQSTTFYDEDDRPIENYGPAPKDWFDQATYRPTLANKNNVPTTVAKYDEGLIGPAVAWYVARGESLFGAPKYHQTGLDTSNTASVNKDFTIAGSIPITPTTEAPGYGISATGKIKFPAAGTYTFRIAHDDGARVFIDDTSVIDNWKTRTAGTAQNIKEGTFIVTDAAKIYRVRIDYIHFDDGTGAGKLNTWLRGPGITDTSGGYGTNSIGSFIVPAYGLNTSTTVTDSVLGNTTIKTNYQDAAYGLVSGVVEDAGGLNYNTAATYEAPGAGYLRQTSKTLPGGGTTSYSYYNATDTADNPCTTTTEAYRQAGMLKGKTEQDPDGTGPLLSRTTENRYDDSGKVIATRFNADAWTCTTYDSRSRIVSTITPTINGRTGSTISNNYAFGNDPFITSTTTAAGIITVETDLLGRTIKYTDARGNITANFYNNAGRLTSRTGPLGNETFVYDIYGRAIDQSLDGVVLARITYDSVNRVSSVNYPAGAQTATMTRDELGRLSGIVYSLANGQSIADAVNRSTSGDIINGTENGVSKSYTYDNPGRLLSATIGTNNFTYDYSTPTSTQCSQVSANLNANKNGNRTKRTYNGVTTTYCYDKADRLLSSSDGLVGVPMYDDHGNTTRLGVATGVGTQTTFKYDGMDRNTGMTEKVTTTSVIKNKTSTKVVTKNIDYIRDAQNRIISRTNSGNITTNGAITSTTAAATAYYGFTGASDTPDVLTNSSGIVQEKYLQLPGNVLLTLRPGLTDVTKSKVYSLPNIHGDIFATTTSTGALLSTHVTGPFGEYIIGQAKPANTITDVSYGYVGQYEKLTESSIALQPIQMGARVYIPILGRFLQVDPVEGGTDNNYAYANDAVNEYDLDGTFIPAIIVGAIYVGGIAWAAYDAKKNPSPTNMGFLALAVVPGGGGFRVGGKVTQTALRKVGGKATKPVINVGKKAKLMVKDAKNLIRIGKPAKDAKWRISFGPTEKYYGKGGIFSRIPFNIHLEKSKGGINTRKGKCIRLWGNWKC